MVHCHAPVLPRIGPFWMHIWFLVAASTDVGNESGTAQHGKNEAVRRTEISSRPSTTLVDWIQAMGVWFCPVLTVVLRTSTEVCTPRDTSLTVFIMARLGTQPPSTRFVVVLNQRGRQAANQVDEC